MSIRLQVLPDEDESRENQGVAPRQRVIVAAGVRQARRKHSGTVDAKLRAIAEASRHEFPTADIEVMLREIEA